MDKNRVDHEHLQVTGAHKTGGAEAHVEIKEEQGLGDILIAITQAYGPKGDQLVGISDCAFDGYPALTLLVQADGREGVVHLSPIHGDSRKEGFTDIPVGTPCELLCPVSREPLPVVGEVEGDQAARYCAIYLTPDLSEGSLVMVSNVWGHYHSRIVDNFELISHWANEEDGLVEG